MGSGSPELEASLTLGHCIIPFLCTLVVQIGTMQCFYCPQKDVSLVPWDSLSSADQALLRDKYPDAGEGAVCEFCVRSARPSAFFSRRSSGSSSSGLPVHMKKKAPQTETVGPSSPPPPRHLQNPLFDCGQVLPFFWVTPPPKRCHFSKMSLKQSALFGYSESAQPSRAHEKKKRHKVKRWDQVTPRTLPKTCFGL